MPNRKTKGNATEPTPKQKLAFKLMTENLSKNPKTIKKGEILRQAGYSEAIAVKPQIVTNSKGWQQLLDQNLSEKTLTTEHHKILTGKYTKDADRLRAIQLGYQLRKKLGTDTPDGEGTTEVFEAVVIRIRKLLPE
jgi:hypothetical protein